MGSARFSSNSSVNSSFGKLQLFDRPAFHILLVALLGLVAYSNTFGVPFQFDDGLNIVQNPTIKEISNIPNIVLGGKGPFASRPLLHVTLALNYYFGRLDPLGYHAVNLALHLINGALLYFLIVMTGSLLGYSRDGTRRAALLTSLLFVVHPIQTQAVTYVVSRSMLLSTMFYLSGIMFFAKTATDEKRRGLNVAGLFVCSLLGMASRENFVLFPVVLFLYDLFFISSFSFRAAARHWRAYALVLLSFGYGIYMILSNTYFKDVDYPGVGIPPMDYFLTQFGVQWTYLRLLVLPVNQNIDYAYPISKTFFSLRTVLGLIGYLGLWSIGILLARKKPVVALSVLWFLVTLIPVSFGITLAGLKLGDVIFEHRIYLPSVGIMAVFGTAACWATGIMESASARKGVALCLVILVAVLLVATYDRNGVWQSETALWGDVVKKSPGNARGHNNLGAAYLKEGLTDKAIEQFTAAIALYPEYATPYYNLGLAYANKGLKNKALEYYETTTRLAPWHAEAHYNLGSAYMEEGRPDEAIEHFEAASKGNRLDAKAYYNLGILYERKGLREKAIEQYQTAIRLKPDYFSAHNNLASILGDMGQMEEAIEHFQIAVKLNPEDATAHNNLGMAYQMMGLTDKAEEHFNKARELSPGEQGRAPAN